MIRLKKIRYFALLLVVVFTLSSCQKDEQFDIEDDGGLVITDVGTVPNEVENIITFDDVAALPNSFVAPNNNLYSNEKFELGRLLFWDPILSGTQTVACATCHHPDFGYADGRELSAGINGTGIGPNRTGGVVIRRNSPTIINTGFNGITNNGNTNPNTAPMFWDNRAMSLEEQALMPIMDHDEMRGPLIAEEDIIDVVLDRLNAIPEYQDLFEDAFGATVITETHLAHALATFQRNITANDSRFDQYVKGNLNALSNQEIQGLNTFLDVGCADCHSGPMFSDYDLHTLSVPDNPLVDDDGATGDFDFRTPTLRNLDFTAPYMHNGAFDNLREVLEFYNDISGGNGDSQNPNVPDNQIAQDARGLNLNNNDINQIITFLNTLNDPDFDRTIPQRVPSGLGVEED